MDIKNSLSKHSLSSLTHTYTHPKTHTKAVSNPPTAGDDDGTPTDEEAVDSEDDRRKAADLDQFSGENRDSHMEIEKLPMNENGLEKMTDEYTYWNRTGDDKENNLIGKTADLAACSSTSKLGLRADGEEEKTPMEDESIPNRLGMADDGIERSEDGETMPTEKDSNLAVNDGELMRRPKLGFGGAPLMNNNGGRQPGTFNMGEFIRLARTVMDTGDIESLKALEDLQTKWKTRFGKENDTNRFPAPEPITEPPLVRGIRKAIRNIRPPATRIQTQETTTTIMDGVSSEECVTTASFSIGLNGNPHDFFAGARGLRQGDPLSPYLFVLIMEVFHMGLQQTIEQDMQFSYHWKCEPTSIFQLGFADDLLLFCTVDLDSLRVLKMGLDRFADWSGLRLNIHKSHVIISRSAQGWKDQILAVMGFQEGQLPMRYLGLPLLSSRLTINDCQPLVLKIDARING
ncbi:UNVERIFIED_CONTAM: hypothetical protein Sindi_0948300 [Sesamum indicum]